MTTDLIDAEQLALAIEVMQDAVAVYDAHARIVLVNERLLVATGHAREELVGQPVLTLVPESLREELTPRMLVFADTPVTRSLEDGLTSRIERKDGSTFEAQVANVPIRAAGGPLVVTSIRGFRDVSLEEIKRRGLLESNPDATVICDPDGHMVVSNTSATRLFEKEHVALFNQDVTSLFPSHYQPALQEALRTCHQDAVAGRQPPQTHTLEIEVIRQDESVVPVEVTISSLRTTQGLTLRLIVHDISERQRQQREAEATKDGFLATVSHELRTPLTSVLGYGELLDDLGQGDLSAHARSLLEVVLRNARRELRLVDDLLTMVRIGEGGFPVQPGRVNFSELVRHAVEASGPVARRAGVSVSVASCGEDAYVQGDPDRLSQAVDNLLTNALKFSRAAGEVDVALSADTEMITLSVINEGEGIQDGDVQHVFERLYRGANAVVAEKQGVGLGLAIVRSIVEAHHGSITAACTATTTCFEINLPCAEGPRVSVPGQRPREDRGGQE